MKISVMNCLLPLGIVFSCLLLHISLLSSISVALVLVILIKLLTNRGDTMPIGNIALALSGIQWLLVPVFEYNWGSVSNYPMSVSENEYIFITLLLYCSFLIGIKLFDPNKYWKITKNELIKFCSSHLKAIKLLIAIGFVSSLVPTITPSLSFILSLFKSFFFIGAIMLCFSYPAKAVMISMGALGYLFVRSIMGGMFHELMVWGLFFVLSLFYIKNYTNRKRFAVAVVVVFSIFTLQAVKPLYRTYTWNSSYSGSRVTLFLNLFMKGITGEIDASSTTSNVTSRFNQGWIISRIYERIPAEQEYLMGKTIWEGIEASLVPRFLNPNKKDSGKDSIKDFETFTGYHLNSQTSMGLSMLGEAYGNFGVIGGAIFMFVWGMIISKVLNLLIRLSASCTYWYFFIPIICQNIIKAEINFISVLNWTVKSFLFVYLTIYFIEHYIISSKCYPFSTEKKEKE